MTTIPTAPAAHPAGAPAAVPSATAAVPPRGGRRQPRRAGPLLLLAVLVVGVPLLCTDITSSVGAGHDVVLAYGLVAHSGIRLARMLARRTPEPVNALFWVFVYVFLAAPALAQITAGTFPLAIAPTYIAADLTSALVTIWVGVLAFDIGRALARRHRRLRPDGTPAPPRPQRFSYRLSPKRMLIVSVVGLVFATLAIRQHGIAPFLDSRDAADTALLNQAPQGSKIPDSNWSNIIENRLVHMPVFIGLYLFLVWRYARPKSVRRPSWEFVLIAALLVVNAIVNNPLSNGRFWFGLVGLTLFSVYVRLDHGPSLRKIVVAGVLVLLLAFPYLDYFRHSEARSLDISSPKASLSAEEGSYSAFQMTVLGSAYVRQHGHTFGSQALGAAGFAVPRSVWSAKPEDTGTLVGGSNFNRASSLWTEAYVDLGYVGVIVVFMAYGAAVAYLDRWFLRRDDELILLVMPVIAAAQWFVLRGSLISALGSIVPLVIAFRLCFKRTRKPVVPERAIAAS